jgi:hypothetical protein
MGVSEQPSRADKSAVCANKSAPTGIRVICLRQGSSELDTLCMDDAEIVKEIWLYLNLA